MGPRPLAGHLQPPSWQDATAVTYPKQSHCNSRSEAIAFPNYCPATETQRDAWLPLHPPRCPADTGLKTVNKLLEGKAVLSGPQRDCLDCFKGIYHLLNYLEKEVNAKRKRESPASACADGKPGKVPPAFGRVLGSHQHPKGVCVL